MPVEKLMNGTYMYIMGAIVILFVLVQSVVFLVRAVRRGKQLGIPAKLMREAAVSSGTFSIVPSVPIVLAMIALAASIGTPLAWIRLSVIGSMSYETIAAGKVLEAAGGNMTLSIFASVIWVMTLGIIAGPLFNIFGLKWYPAQAPARRSEGPRVEPDVDRRAVHGHHRGDGRPVYRQGHQRFCQFRKYSGICVCISEKTNEAAGAQVATAAQYLGGFKAQILTLITGVVLMLVFGAVIKLTKAKWLENFALPVSMIGAVALSVVYHGLFMGVA